MELYHFNTNDFMTSSTVKDKSLATLIKELDTQISLFVRLNAADENGTIKCISCDDKVFWVDSDCCHYKDRNNMATRFHLPNLAPGCKDCNRYNKDFHISEWTKKIGTYQAQRLGLLSKSLLKWTRPELEEMILDYRDKVAKIRKEKNL